MSKSYAVQRMQGRRILGSGEQMSRVQGRHGQMQMSRKAGGRNQKEAANCGRQYLILTEVKTGGEE